MISVTVKGQSARKYINRVSTGEYDDQVRSNIIKVWTNKGAFEINFVDNGEYTIELFEENEPINNTEDTKTIVLKNQVYFKRVDDDVISVKNNFRLLFPLLQIIRMKTNSLNIWEVEGPPVEPPIAEISEENMVKYREMLEV